MKRIILCGVSALLLAACDNPGDKQPTGDKTAMVPVANVMSGTWVMSDYLNDLRQTGSPKASSPKLNGVVSMLVDASLVQGDTILVSASLNNHEGLNFYLFLRQGQNEHSLQTDHTTGTDDSYELSYSIKDDTVLQLLHYDKDKKLVDSRDFTKVRGPLTEESEPYGLQYMVNKVLFSGRYRLIDEDSTKNIKKQSTENSGREIELTDDGMVRGMQEHKTYYVFTDFLGDVETNLDEMAFDPQTKNQKPYIFQVNGDTIRLYKALENEDRTLLVTGALRYTLIKQH